MIRRLLLLLALLVALPATARPACHDASAPTMAGMSAHRMGGHDDAGGGMDRAPRSAHTGAHDCLGCIPPDMLLGARVVPAHAVRAPARRMMQVAFPRARTTAPTPPPPKTA